MLRIAIVVGSTRPGRLGESVSRWAYEIARKRTDAEFELVVIFAQLGVLSNIEAAVRRP